MKRINLKTVKEVLNKIPDKELENVFITHPYGIENPGKDELVVVKYAEDYAGFFQKYDTKILTEFAKGVFEDSKKIMVVISNPAKVDDYSDDIEG